MKLAECIDNSACDLTTDTPSSLVGII